MAGAYDVETFIRNGQEVPLAAKDRSRWEKVIIDNASGGALNVRQLDSEPSRSFQFRLRLEHDAAKKLLLTTRPSNNQRMTLAYAIPDPEHLELSGTLQQGNVWMRLRKIDVSQFRLTKRRLHLVQPNALGKPDWAAVP
jgi:hypothetical protein